MSNYLVEQYLKEGEKVIRYGGSRKETSIRNTFHKLFKRVCTVSVETLGIQDKMCAVTGLKSWSVD
ncbi:hypothetical protein [Halalkalibaculum sp. DA384]|uniref:hypothetical protein n=1 Tax=Halalkalibaculum sp. DA384 TaxID=3373606 RepID=UPI00375481A1